MGLTNEAVRPRCHLILRFWSPGILLECRLMRNGHCGHCILKFGFNCCQISGPGYAKEEYVMMGNLNAWCEMHESDAWNVCMKWEESMEEVWDREEGSGKVAKKVVNGREVWQSAVQWWWWQWGSGDPVPSMDRLTSKLVIGLSPRHCSDSDLFWDVFSLNDYAFSFVFCNFCISMNFWLFLRCFNSRHLPTNKIVCTQNLDPME